MTTLDVPADGIWSLDAYRLLIGRALERGCAFSGFGDPEGDVRQRVYLRHDVDYSLTMAVQIAEMNASLGVRATFFVLLRSQVYNLLSSWSQQQVRKIHACGQRLGLHAVAPDVLPGTNEQLAAAVLHEMAVVRDYLPEVGPVFAWHNPTAELLERSADLTVPGLVDVYGRAYFRDIPYWSDSNLVNSPADLDRALAEPSVTNAQLLLHPENWVAGGADMVEVLCRTWKAIVREREVEMNSNREWRRHLPSGLPDECLDAFVALSLASARRASPR